MPCNWGDINHLSKLWSLHCLTIINSRLLSRGSVEWLRGLESDMTTVELYGSSASEGMTAAILHWSIKPVTKHSATIFLFSDHFLLFSFPFLCPSFLSFPFVTHPFLKCTITPQSGCSFFKALVCLVSYSLFLLCDSFPVPSTRAWLPWSSAAKASALTSSRDWPRLLSSPMTFT